jgi:hypothetical protein
LAKELCLTPKCDHIAAADCRGLCLKCYSAAKKLVESNRTTWEDLENMNLVRPKSSGSLFIDAFEKRLGGGK